MIRMIMRRWITLILIFALAASGGLAADATAADGGELYDVYQQMIQAKLEEGRVYALDGFVLSARDFKLRVNSGSFHFFEPVTIDGEEHYWGGYVTGDMIFQFSPQLPMERQQLNRYYASDSLYRVMEQAIVLFNDTLASQVMLAGQSQRADEEQDLEEPERLFEEFTRMGEHYFVIETLRNAVLQQRRPFLLVNGDLIDGGPTVYEFNPQETEEVKLFQRYKEFIVALRLEPVVSYSVYADQSYTMLNGIDRERLYSRHYSIDATLSLQGDLEARCEMTCEVALSGTQMVWCGLNHRLHVDSVHTSEGERVPFLRDADWRNRSRDLHLFLPRPMEKGEQVKLVLYYSGPALEKTGPVYVFTAGDSWYPRHRYDQLATFDMTFRTPADLTFECSAAKTAHRPLGDQTESQWVVSQPDAEISFIFGEFEQSEATVDQTQILTLLSDESFRYVAEELENDPAYNLSNRWQIATLDFSNSFKFFSEFFGEYHRNRLIVTESYINQGADQSGLIRANWETILYDDKQGENRLKRTELLAKQWWGHGVRFDSYRDQWLSDGFSAYSALMYLQAAQGNNDFMWWLRNFRDHIYRAYNRPNTQREESGAIALGNRSLKKTNELVTEIAQGRSWSSLEGDQSQQIAVSGSSRELSAVTEAALTDRTDLLSGQLEGVPDVEEDRLLTRLSGKAFRPMAYYRGAYVLHMLRSMLTDLETLDDQAFFDLLREFYTTWYGKNPTTMDFKQLVDLYCGIDMTWFFDQWVYGYALPEYEFSYEVTPADDGNFKAIVTIKQHNVPANFKMFVPVEIEFDTGKKAYLRLLVDRPELQVSLPPLQSRPKDIRFNPFNAVLAKVKQ